MLIHFHNLLWSYLQRVPIFLAMTVYIYIYDVWEAVLHASPGYRSVSNQLQKLDSDSLKKPSVLYQKRNLFNIRSMCYSVAQMCHITKGHYVTTYLWPWHHKKPKSIMISVQNGQAHIKWPCDMGLDVHQTPL